MAIQMAGLHLDDFRDAHRLLVSIGLADEQRLFQRAGYLAQELEHVGPAGAKQELILDFSYVHYYNSSCLYNF